MASTSSPATGPSSTFREAMSYVTWSPLFFGCVAFIATVSTWHFGTPVLRPFFIYDASLSGAKGSPENTLTVPVSMVVSIILALFQFYISEFVLMAKVRRKSMQIAMFVQAILHTFCVFWFTSWLQQFFSLVVGKQRPSFFEECQPRVEAYAQVPGVGSPAFRNLGLDYTYCTDTTHIEDASKSFFSGHSSSTTLVTLFGMMHFIYTMNVRAPPRWSAGCKPTLKDVRLADFKRGFILLFMASQFLWFLGVGMSRFIDNKHHIEDVIFGIVVGIVFAVLGFVDMIGAERDLLARTEYLELAEKQYDVGMSQIL